MGGINMGRVVAGGLLAGLLMNVSQYLLHLVHPLESDPGAVKALGLLTLDDLGVLMWRSAATILLGVLTLWCYAAVRPRFGPGPGTAFRAGLVVWAMAILFPAIFWEAPFHNNFSYLLVWLPVGWRLVEVPLATTAGAWIYKE